MGEIDAGRLAANSAMTRARAYVECVEARGVRWPERRWLYSSYGAQLSIRDSVNCRRLLLLLVIEYYLVLVGLEI